MKRLLAILILSSCSSPPALDDPASDPGTGTDVSTPDPGEPDPCRDADQCPASSDPPPPGPTDPDAPHIGSALVTTAYAGFYTQASSAASVIDVPPHGGVPDDSLHPYRNPTGVIPPSQTVTLLDVTSKNGFWNVRYEGKSGWISSHKLVFESTQVPRIEFAARIDVRNAFFKHQIYRTTWNKDGPLHSGNCAPTSLAMAIAAFGKEPAGLSVEESIHRVRHVYDPGLNESQGSSRADIAKAATTLGMKVTGLNTTLSPDAALKRIDTQLAAGRAVVLEGEPGDPNTTKPSVYEAAMTAAYTQAIQNGMKLYHSTYNFDGYHAIVVIGKDGSGRYIVGDPLSEVGFVPLAAAPMKDFFTRWGGTGNAVE